MATARESTQYTFQNTNKYLINQPGERGGPVYRMPFELTVVSASATGDTYKLLVVPKSVTVVGGHVVTQAMGASAGAGVTLDIGDADDTDRLFDALDCDALNANAALAAAGMNWEPTADTVVYATFTGAAVVGKVVKGYIDVIFNPAA